MKLLEMIEQLQELYKKHGDLPVRHNVGSSEVLVSLADAYNEHGSQEQYDGVKENHVFIH